MLFRVTLLACCAMAFSAQAAVANTTITYIPADGVTLDNLRVLGDDQGNEVTITSTPQGYTFTANGPLDAGPAPACTGGGNAPVLCTVSPPSISVDLAEGNDKLHATSVRVPILAAGGLGDDLLEGGTGDDVLAGGDNNDTLRGGPGLDQFFGEGGNDIIFALDGVSERISCGSGDDSAQNDPIDIIADCEAGRDEDHDGFASFVDCNDADAAIHPGVVDVFENGIDENCDGVDARNLDRDGDGFPIPADCNDADATIHPGALEVRGNQVDENCDSRAQGFGMLRSLVSSNWQFGATFTRLRALVVRNAPAGTRIAVACKGKGCPFKGTKRRTVSRDLAPVSLRTFFGKAKLRRGARVIVTVTAAQFVGRTYTYRVRVGELPATSIVCRAPGERKGRTCG